jgi:uncharacterized ferritin-like protein (DUF455 family)
MRSLSQLRLIDMNLYEAAYQCLMISDISQKQRCVDALYHDWKGSKLERAECELKHIEIPGRPAKPDLVSPAKLKQRKLGSKEGRATLIHAITHIEFNAINLALDAVYRFREMPDEYYTDWLQVAFEEAYHFDLLHQRLAALGYQYGDFPAHNGLWEMVLKTDHDVMVRMALIPRVLEARGLDVTPPMMQKLEKAGDMQTVDALKIILRDEIGHVAIGSRWFKYCCELREINPEQTFRDLLCEYMTCGLREPLHKEARLQAGFTQEEIDELVKMT